MIYKMMTKWEWIASEVRKLGYPNLAEMALVIDKHIAEIYGDSKITRAWIRDFATEIATSHQDPKSIYHIFMDSKYCYPCTRVNIRALDCPDCEYGQKYGLCESINSEFGFFRYVFLRIFEV